jgi:hypothetical protein
MIKMFVKGIFIGLGILVICLPIAIAFPVFANRITTNEPASLGYYDITPNGYAFTWIPTDESCQDMSTRLGVQINQIQKGGIIVGYMNNSNHTPIIKQGIIITFDKLPTTTVTDKLDFTYGTQGFQRTGGKSVVDTLIKADTIK